MRNRNSLFARIDAERKIAATRYLPPPTKLEKRFLYISAFVSAAIGIGVAYSIWDSSKVDAIIFLGLAHAVVFVATGIFIHANRTQIVLYGIVCLLFPIWGTFLGVCGMYIFSAFLCSLLWGGIVADLLGQRLAFGIFAIIGIIPTFKILYPFTYSNSGGITDVWFPLEIGYWHVAASIALVYLGLRKRKELALLIQDQCPVFDYSLVGLPKDTICPECGYRDD